MLVQEAEALHAEVQILQAEAGQLRRDNELKAEMEAQCARRGVTQVNGSILLPTSAAALTLSCTSCLGTVCKIYGQTPRPKSVLPSELVARCKGSNLR